MLAMIGLTLLTLGYSVTCRPWKTNALNNMDIANEFTLLLVLYLMLAFTDLVGDKNTQYKVGYLVCLLTAINILINMGVLMTNSVLGLMPYLKKKCARRNLPRREEAPEP
jgi:uncharacterized membrane protein YhaH (DUF805 family)